MSEPRHDPRYEVRNYIDGTYMVYDLKEKRAKAMPYAIRRDAEKFAKRLNAQNALIEARKRENLRTN